MATATKQRDCSSRYVDYATLTERRCSRCKTTKPVDQFKTHTDARALNGWRYRSECQPCEKASTRRRYERRVLRRETRRAQAARWRSGKNPERKPSAPSKHLLWADATANLDPRLGLAPLAVFEGSIRLAGNFGCWEWTGWAKRGYGQVWVGERTFGAHRFSYELHRAEIPDGLQIDHLCRNTLCVNPWHLEPVTGQVNVRRAAGWHQRFPAPPNPPTDPP